MSKKGYSIPLLFPALLLAVSTLFLAECSVGVHEEVYSHAAAKARVVSNVVITPSAEGEYAFTADAITAVTIDCANGGAQAYYSFDGAPYRPYTGPLALPINDLKVDQTILLSAYSTHPDYVDSEPVTQAYRFVATRVPAPTIGAVSSPYYRYDKPPRVTVSCSLAGATVWYSTNGGATYTQTNGSFDLPVPGSADWNVNRTIELTVYATSPDYLDSAPVSETFLFYGEGAIVTIAGTGIEGFPVEGEDARTQNLPEVIAIFVDDGRNVYFTGGHCVWKVSGSTNAITRLAGMPGFMGSVNSSGDARTNCLQDPRGLTGDNAGHILYIAATGSCQILYMPYEGGIITRILGWPSGAIIATDPPIAPNTGIYHPSGIQYSADDGLIYYSETSRNVVRSFTPSGGPLKTVAGTLEESGNDNGHFTQNKGLCVEGNTMYVADADNNRLCTVTLPGDTIDTLLAGKTGVSQVRKIGSDIYYMCWDGPVKVIERYNGTNTKRIVGSATPIPIADGILATDVMLNSSEDFFVVPGDGIYIPDWMGYRVFKVILY